MRKLGFLLLSFTLMRSCCPVASHVEPPYPKDIAGWYESDKYKGEVKGSFVLRKGEETSNGKITIQVVDLLPGSVCDRGSQDGGARAKLRFIRTEDRQTLCEDEFPDHGFRSLEATQCGDRLQMFGISVITIKAVSLENGWAHVWI